MSTHEHEYHRHQVRFFSAGKELKKLEMLPNLPICHTAPVNAPENQDEWKKCLAKMNIDPNHVSIKWGPLPSQSAQLSTLKKTPEELIGWEGDTTIQLHVASQGMAIKKIPWSFPADCTDNNWPIGCPVKCVRTFIPGNAPKGVLKILEKEQGHLIALQSPNKALVKWEDGKQSTILWNYITIGSRKYGDIVVQLTILVKNNTGSKQYLVHLERV